MRKKAPSIDTFQGLYGIVQQTNSYAWEVREGAGKDRIWRIAERIQKAGNYEMAKPNELMEGTVFGIRILGQGKGKEFMRMT